MSAKQITICDFLKMATSCALLRKVVKDMPIIVYLCILCNGCVDVCPTDCLKLVPVAEVEGDEMVTTVINWQTASWAAASAMLLDPTRCIRCGLCAARCPTEAVKMETFRFTEEIIYEPQEELR